VRRWTQGICALTVCAGGLTVCAGGRRACALTCVRRWTQGMCTYMCAQVDAGHMCTYCAFTICFLWRNPDHSPCPAGTDASQIKRPSRRAMARDDQPVHQVPKLICQDLQARRCRQSVYVHADMSAEPCLHDPCHLRACACTGMAKRRSPRAC